MRTLVVFEDRSGHDHFLDHRRTLVDLQPDGVSEQPLDRVLGAVATAAEQHDRLFRCAVEVPPGIASLTLHRRPTAGQ